MSLSPELKKTLEDMAGAQQLSSGARLKMRHFYDRWCRWFPSLNWYGNSPIEPTGAGLTYAESITWIRFCLHHLQDWLGGITGEVADLDDRLDKLGDDLLKQLEDELQNTILPEMVEKYFNNGILIDGNSERITTPAIIESTDNNPASIWTNVYEVLTGTVEMKAGASVVNDPHRNVEMIVNCQKGSDYLQFVKNIQIPASAVRVWVMQEDNTAASTSNFDIYYTAFNVVYKAVVNSTTDTSSLIWNQVITNYNVGWITAVFRKDNNDTTQYLRYLTTDYKLYEKNLTTGDETLIVDIPSDKIQVFDPISDVIDDGKVIFAVSYNGTTQRFVQKMQGLVLTTDGFDGANFYEQFDEVEPINFSDQKWQGINPKNIWHEEADRTEETFSSTNEGFILAYDSATTVHTAHLVNKVFSMNTISTHLQNYYNEWVVSFNAPATQLSEYQGYFTYFFRPGDLAKFSDVPDLMIKDSDYSIADTYVMVENSKHLLLAGGVKVMQQKLYFVNADFSRNVDSREFTRTINIDLRRNTHQVSRWQETTADNGVSSSMADFTKLDWFSVLGSQRQYIMQDFETGFTDTPVKTYHYYNLPVTANHPLFQNAVNKYVKIDVDLGVEDTVHNVFQATFYVKYVDDYAELCFERTLTFNLTDIVRKYGGKFRADRVSPWRYVYYTHDDDTAPDGYDQNPVLGVTKEWQDKIDNLQNQINILGNAFKKVVQNLQDKGVWQTPAGEDILQGGFAPGMGVAGGNINLFGGTEDGAKWIRTNNGSTEDDLAGGV